MVELYTVHVFKSIYGVSGRKLQGQSHGRQFLLKSTYKTSCLKSSVCAKVDGWKALLGISIAYCVARSWSTTLLEPVALRAGERRAWA